MLGKALYFSTIFLSVFLLFQVQPLIAKMLLPWFEGEASVWITCMLFFQMVLLGGYIYAHWLINNLKPSRQIYGSDWVLMTSTRNLCDVPEIKEVAADLRPRKDLRVWTDNYSNLIQILKINKD